MSLAKFSRIQKKIYQKDFKLFKLLVARLYLSLGRLRLYSIVAYNLETKFFQFGLDWESTKVEVWSFQNIAFKITCIDFRFLD